MNIELAEVFVDELPRFQRVFVVSEEVIKGVYIEHCHTCKKKISCSSRRFFVAR
jgi:hypothetical protein